MSRVVLSIGSNLGDRLGRLQSVVDALGDRAHLVSPVYETDPWGGVDQEPFLNAVLVAEDRHVDGYGWLRLGQQLERAADRVRGQKWGPRTLDVDLVRVQEPAGDGLTEVFCRDDALTLPHPLTQLRAFVMIPWLAVEPDAQLPVADEIRPVARLLAELDPAERAAVRPSSAALRA